MGNGIGAATNPDDVPVAMRGIANFGGPGRANAEMNRSDSIPSKGGLAGVTMGAKTGADAIMKHSDQDNKEVVQTAGKNV